MKKFILSLTILLSMVTLSSTAQVLYRVSGNGLSKPSYLLGTFHLAKSTFVDSIPGFRQAFSQIDQVYGELVMSEMNESDNAMKLMSAMMLPDGQTIKDLLTEDELQRLNKIMKEYLQMDLSTSMAMQAYGRMRPAALNTLLTIAIYSRMLPGVSANNGIDEHVQTLAKESGKPVGGLEGIDDQIVALFTGTPAPRQAKLLMCVVDHIDYNVAISKQLIDAYYSQNLEQIETIVNDKMGDGCDNTDEENELLITGRNKAWMNKIPTLITEKPTMIAVGAAHLVGEEGLISLLRAKGYTVEGVKCCKDSKDNCCKEMKEQCDKESKDKCCKESKDKCCKESKDKCCKESKDKCCKESKDNCCKESKDKCCKESKDKCCKESKDKCCKESKDNCCKESKDKCCKESKDNCCKESKSK